jgi:hypothetical protein
VRRLRWTRRLEEVKRAERVKLKTLETLAKEGSALVGTMNEQEGVSEEMREDVRMVNLQVGECKRWTEEQNRSDMATNQEIKRMLDLGRDTLRFELDDFVDLKNFYSDTCEWKDITKKLLTQGHRIPEYTPEFLKKHIDLAIN